MAGSIPVRLRLLQESLSLDGSRLGASLPLWADPLAPECSPAGLSVPNSYDSLDAPGPVDHLIDPDQPNDVEPFATQMISG